MVALFYTLSFGFAAGSDRTLQAFLERYVEMADCDELSYAAFHDWFEPGVLHFFEKFSMKPLRISIPDEPTRFRTTDGKTHERSQLTTGEWAAGALILLDLGFYDFWLFDRIDKNDGWFVSHVKDDAH